MDPRKVKALERLMDDIEIEAQETDSVEHLHSLADKYAELQVEYFLLTGKQYGVERKV